MNTNDRRLKARDELSRAIVDLRGRYPELPVTSLCSVDWEVDSINVAVLEVGQGAFSLFWESIDDNFCANQHERAWLDKSNSINPLAVFRQVEYQLQYIYRYNSAFAHRRVSVATHSSLVFKLAKLLFPGNIEIQREALLHDLHEVVTGDVVYHVKRLIPWFDELESIVNRRLKHFIFPTYEDPTVDVSKQVHLCDVLAFFVEVDALSAWPLTHRVKNIDWSKAYDDYVHMAEETGVFFVNADEFKDHIRGRGKEFLFRARSMETHLRRSRTLIS